ncbi:unnamed protein product [Gongylonema pulchrum]|uniref:BRCT domain-containing protein n=1 Tax=Gongylonema pulchrum TaxID=637853 RepID=A0A183EL17_9BILA|nr:unnamed protein product [Gongylonema pulchrum]
MLDRWLSKIHFARTLRSAAFENHQLSTVEALLGTPERDKDMMLLGMLTQKSPKFYEIEDLTGTMRVDLREAKFYRGLFTDGCIMLMQGRCSGGVFHVSAIGLPPTESAKITRGYFGTVNWFGGESTVAYCAQPKLRALCERNNSTRFVIISDAWLDEQRVMFTLCWRTKCGRRCPCIIVSFFQVLQGISELVYAFTDSQLLVFVICGNFCSPVGAPNVYQRIAGRLTVLIFGVICVYSCFVQRTKERTACDTGNTAISTIVQACSVLLPTAAVRLLCSCFYERILLVFHELSFFFFFK